MYYSIIVKIPSLKEDWGFKSITTYQQKEICKTFLLNNNNILLKTLDKVIQQCIDPQHCYQKLTITDKIVILLKLRWESIGDSIEILVEKEDKKYNTQYSLIEIAEKFYNVCTNIRPLYIDETSFKIVCDIPNIDLETSFIEAISNEDATYNSIMHFFIKSITINGDTLSLAREDIQQILENIPATLHQKILLYVKDIITSINGIKIYSYFNEEIYFNYNFIYVDFLKFFLKEDLYGIYQDIYLLSKTANFSSDYIENISPLERQLYLSFITQERQQLSKSTSASHDIPIETGIDSFDSFMNQMGG